MKNVSIGILISLSTILGIAEAASQRFHPQHLFIKMKPGQSLVRSPLITSSKRIIGQIYLVKTRNPKALAQALQKEPGIEYVEHDYYSTKRATPKHEILEPLKNMSVQQPVDQLFNDPEVGNLWAFQAAAGLDVLGAYANLPPYTPNQIVVAVVDTGVDHNHEDLKDVMWTNEDEIPGDKIDNDGNGYIDDIHGINTLIRDEAGRATMNTTPSSIGGSYHGTHVAGTIGATQNNQLGIAGVASNVKIMAIRTVPDSDDELDSDIVEAYVYAAKNGAKVINCSFGKNVNEGGMVVRDTINLIGKRHGVLVVASAGNDSQGNYDIWHDNDVSLKYPASFDSENLLVIASTAVDGKFSSFSNIGLKTVDVASPGSKILSTLPGDKYGFLSGTSMAAPNASGVAAMVLGYFPTINATELKAILMSSVTKVPLFSGKIASGGRLNLNQALKTAQKISESY